MKTKNYFIKSVFFLTVMFIFSGLYAQEMVVNGGMDSEEGWTAYEMGATEPMGGWEWDYWDTELIEWLFAQSRNKAR